MNIDPEYYYRVFFFALFTNISNFSVIAKCSVSPSTSVKDLKVQVQAANKKLTIHRQALRQEVKGKILKDSDTVELLGLRNGGKLYVKDLGPQIGWSTGEFFDEFQAFFYFFVFQFFSLSTQDLCWFIWRSISVRGFSMAILRLPQSAQQRSKLILDFELFRSYNSCFPALPPLVTRFTTQSDSWKQFSSIAFRTQLCP